MTFRYAANMRISIRIVMLLFQRLPDVSLDLTAFAYQQVARVLSTKVMGMNKYNT